MVDVGKLEGVVDELARAARDVAPHTLKSYVRRWRMWDAFAEHHGVTSLPADPEHVQAFVVSRHDAGVSPSGIAANLSAVGWFHSRYDERSTVTEGARAVLRALSKAAPGPPIRSAPVLSVGALLAMVQLPQRSGTTFATKLVRGALPDVAPRQLLTVEVGDVTWGPGDAWADVRMHATEAAGTHRALPAITVRLRADPGWVACPVRALRVLTAAAGEGLLFSEGSLFKASTGSFNVAEATEGIHARLQVRDSTVVCVGYGGALRNEELSRARVEHLQPVRDGFLLGLPEAKTTRSLPNQSVFLQRRDDALDPVAALHRWLAVRGDHDGPLFVHLHHRSSSRVADGDGLPSGSIKNIVQALATRAGLSEAVSGYSLRRSWATHQYLADPDSIGLISLQLRHGDIDMTVRYIEDLRLGLIEPAVLLSADAVVAGPGGVVERRKDIGFTTAPLDELVERARQLLAPEAGYAATTLRPRSAHWSVWEKFADKHGIAPMPATPEALALFVAERADEGRRPTYLQQQLKTIERRHVAAGLATPGMTGLAEEVLDAYARSGMGPPVKAPILGRGDLVAMAHQAGADPTPLSLRDLVVVTAGYAGAMRADDLRRARLEDIEPAPWGAIVRLRASKDNPAGQAAEVIVLLRRHDALDAIDAIERFRTVTGLTSGPLIPTTPGADIPLSYDGIVGRLRRLAATTGAAPVPSGHSLRRSWATHAYEDGVDLVTIQRHLRHENIRDTTGYVGSLSPWVDNAAVTLADTLLAPLEAQATRALR